MWTKKFWTDAAERLLSTAAQAAIAAWGVSSLIQSVNWAVVGGTAAGAAVLSLLKSVAASRTGDPSSASLVQ